MNKFHYNINPVTTYCSKEYYEREVKKFIWDYRYKLVKRELKSFMKHFGKFLYLIYKYYLQDAINFLLGLSIFMLVYFILNGIILAVENYIK